MDILADEIAVLAAALPDAAPSSVVPFAERGPAEQLATVGIAARVRLLEILAQPVDLDDTRRVAAIGQLALGVLSREIRVAEAQFAAARSDRLGELLASIGKMQSDTK